MLCSVPDAKSRSGTHKFLTNSRRSVMKWETPSASDFRFGFEITMYIATR